MDFAQIILNAAYELFVHFVQSPALLVMVLCGVLWLGVVNVLGGALKI